MPPPPQDVATLFADLWQDLPPETVEMAREFKACARARKIKPHNVPLVQRDGTPVDWVPAWRQQAPATVCTLPVQLGTADAAPGPLWGQAYRLPPAPANKARRRCRQQPRKNGHHPNKLPLWLAAGVLVVTTRPPTLLPGPMALAVYRVRWPIEVALKRWKSVLDVALLRARYESPLVEVWWHGQ